MKTLLLILPAFFYCFNSFSQSALLDQSFGAAGLVITDLPGYESDFASALALLPDGKILIAGTAANGFTDNSAFVARYNVDGSLDTTFGNQGIVLTSICTCETATDIVVQPDGKIVLSGDITASGSYDVAIYRFNEDGSPDSTFDSDGFVTIDHYGDNESGESLALQDDGKIVVAGFSEDDFLILRCNPDGSIDSTFNNDGMVTTHISLTGFAKAHDVAIQPDGKIVAAGQAQGILSDILVAVARYNSNGSLDNTFSLDGKLTTKYNTLDYAYGLVIQPDQKIVVTGNTNSAFLLIRYKSDGSLDSTLSSDGIQTTNVGLDFLANSVTLQPDNKIVVAGFAKPNSSASIDFVIVRYDDEGNPDPGFNFNGIVNTDFDGFADYCFDMEIQSDGKILAAGWGHIGLPSEICLARYLPGCPVISAGFIYDAPDQTVSFTDQTPGATWWFWTFGDGGTDTLQNPVHVYSFPGGYQVCLVAGDTCSSDTVCDLVTVIPTGLQDFSFDHFLFPNPFSNHLQIHYTLSEPGELIVYDALGRKVKSCSLPSNQKVFQLSLSELPAGIYLVAINSGGKSFMEKVVKE